MRKAPARAKVQPWATLPAWETVQRPFARFFDALPLPNMNPDVVSLFMVAAAFFFVAAYAQGFRGVAWCFLALHLFLDGAEASIARRFAFRKMKKDAEHGRRADIVADRASEAILFSWPAFADVWFPLFLLNVCLVPASFGVQRNLTFPLRQAFFIAFTILLFL